MIRARLLSCSVCSTGLGMMLLATNCSQPTSDKSAIVPPQPDIQYKSYILPTSVVHTLLIPASRREEVIPAVANSLETVEDFAEKHQALAAINGGFFDPVNQKTTSIVIRQEQILADPKDNDRLINNPKNAPYLNQMLNRSEFRRYTCGETTRYSINLRREPIPEGCRLVDALGGGPRLLPELGSLQEGFMDVVNGKVKKDALGSDRPNARTAIGITHEGSILWVMVAQKPDAPKTSGMSLPQLADFMKSLGVERAMNLDGGSSSCFYYKGKTFYGKVDTAGKLVKRPIKSVLLVESK